MRAFVIQFSVLINTLVMPVAMAAPLLPEPVKHQASPYAPVNQLPSPVLTPRLMVSAHLQPGSLQSNVRKIAKQFGWNQVIWNVPSDYEWVGDVNITAPNFNGVLTKVLANYPLQAVFYHGNHVLVIAPRTLINEEE